MSTLPGRDSRQAARLRNPLTVAVAVSLWLACVGNWPLWRALLALPELATPRGKLFIVGAAVAVTAGLVALLSLAAWRYTIKPVACVMLLAAAAGAYFMGSYGIVIDPTMMVSVLQTDGGEVTDLLDWNWLFAMLWLAVLPIYWLWRTPLRRLALPAQAWRNALCLIGALWLAGALAVLGFADLSSTLRNHKSLRYMINPLNSVYSLAIVGIRGGAHRAAEVARPIGLDTRLAADRGDHKPPLLLLIIGETARADHFSLNGYARATNAATAPLGVISFSEVTSCGTSTAASLPCMFSHLGRERYLAREHDYQNLLDVVQQAGMAVLWLDNQGGCKGLCARVPHGFAHDPPPGVKLPAGLCDGDECLDAALLVGLDQRLAALPQAQRERGVLLVLHLMGSHGPAYFKRSPSGMKPFLPECTSSALQKCTHDELINAYDNSIAYTDHMLAAAVAWLKTQTTAFAPMLLYVADHGESLGENNLYLHGMPLAIAPPEQTHVPMLLWLPASSEAAAGVSAECLRARKALPASHDNLFPTVLGLLDLTGSVYRAEWDIAEPCRALSASG